MKNNTTTVIRIIAPALVLAAIFLLPPRVSSQDTLSAKPEKKIAVKIKLDEDGTTLDIDTTFIIDSEFKEEAMEQAMKKYELQMKKFGHEMEKMEHLKQMKKMKEMQLKWSCDPGQFEHLDICESGPGHCILRTMPRHKGETLSDLLGDIPMRAVKSYTIKELKGGKRITIEISDDALIECSDDKVMIWRQASPHQRPMIRKEIRIDTGSDVPEPVEVEIQEEPESPED